MQSRILTLILCVNLFFNFGQVHSKNVLFLYPNASPSHKNIAVPIMHGLAERGHNVTVVSSFSTEPHPNIRDIHPIQNFEYFKSEQSIMDVRRQGIPGMIFFDYEAIFAGCRRTYESPEVQALLKEKFDLVLMDAFGNECLMGFVYKLGAPFIYVCPLPVPSFISNNVGNRLPPSIVPTFIGSVVPQLSFLERAENTVLNELATWGFRRPLRQHEEIYKEYLGNDLPHVEDILTNMSMILTNSHFSFNLPRPNLPDVVEIGGIHCRPGKALPMDLNDFVSGAKDGLILFSLGSIVRPHEMPEETRRAFVNVFSRLKQRVLWKWSKEMPDAPPNVMISKWIPQQDVLAHPNTRLFITHSGLLGTQEAIYHSVPMVAFPVMGDQNINARLASEAGIAVTLEILDLTEEKLEAAINQVLHDKNYKERITKLSEYLRDEPKTPKERAVFWAEYVIRHNGARHLRSAARELNFIQYYCLDIITVLTLIVGAVVLAFVAVAKRVVRLLQQRLGKQQVLKKTQ